MSEEILQTGSIVHRDEPLPPTYSHRHAWVTCGLCREKRIGHLPTGKKDRATWTGLCVPCSGVHRRSRSQDETHATGTIIHWGERDPAKPLERVAITCHQCHHKSFTHIQSIKHAKWSGLCGKCIEQRGSHLKFTHDERFESGTIIHWGEPDPKAPDKRLMVSCGHCGGKRSITRVAASILKHDGGSWRCRQCHNDALRAHFAIQRGSNSGGVKPQRARGRESGALGFDHDRFMSDLESHVTALSKTISAWNITQKAVAERFQLDGEDISADGVRKRLALCGVTQKWREFVESVIRAEPEIKSII
jgi:hypothetical protein